MLSLEEVRKIMENSGYSDEKLLKIRDDFYTLAELVLNSIEKHKKTDLYGRSKKSYNNNVDPLDE